VGMIGTFIIGDGTAKNIFPFSGTWKFEKVPYKRCCFKEILWYFSIGKINNEWVLETKLQVLTIHQNILKL
jgi:hypothetical protein